MFVTMSALVFHAIYNDMIFLTKEIAYLGIQVPVLQEMSSLIFIICM